MKARHFLAMILVAAALLCPLSMGPLSGWYARHYRRPPDALVVFYNPLWWTAQKVPLAGEALNWYTSLWTPPVPFNL